MKQTFLMVIVINLFGLGSMIFGADLDRANNACKLIVRKNDDKSGYETIVYRYNDQYKEHLKDKPNYASGACTSLSRLPLNVRTAGILHQLPA